ncbi:PAS domain-containing protein [Streptomyces sp. NBC_01198]|uniref:PAS domain-containing protein n=1 Tax=Streptomyces sp. NBC_01198 TaxID=2903769 RepID=UPI002E0F5843|nr:PAS domain-containing protein [Streptomyces sp. NBC_01198]
MAGASDAGGVGAALVEALTRQRHVGVLVLDEDLRVEQVISELGTLHVTTGKPVTDSFLEDADSTRDMLEGVLAGGEPLFDLEQAVVQDGGAEAVELTALRLDSGSAGEAAQLLLVMSDVTERWGARRTQLRARQRMDVALTGAARLGASLDLLTIAQQLAEALGPSAPVFGDMVTVNLDAGLFLGVTPARERAAGDVGLVRAAMVTRPDHAWPDATVAPPRGRPGRLDGTGTARSPGRRHRASSWGGCRAQRARPASVTGRQALS